MLMTALASAWKSEHEQLEVVGVDVYAEHVKLKVGDVLVDITILHLEFHEPLLGAFVFHHIDEGLPVPKPARHSCYGGGCQSFSTSLGHVCICMVQPSTCGVSTSPRKYAHHGSRTMPESQFMIMNLLNLVRKTSVLLRSPVNTRGGEYQGWRHCTCGIGGICGIHSCSHMNAGGALRNLACVCTAGPVSICCEEDKLNGRQPWACTHDASAACAEVVFA
jgi:hypothetical protein